MTGRAIEQLDLALAGSAAGLRSTSCRGSPSSPRLEIAPLDVGPALREGVWEQRTAILTSATIPSSLPQRVGLAGRRPTIRPTSAARSTTPHHALLYCAMHLPDPRIAGYRDAVHDELAALITAAGGRTLALFTSWKAMDLAAAAVRERVDVPILTQRDLPKPALVARFAADEATCAVRHGRVLPGRRRPRPHAEPGRHRPAAVPPPRRPAAVGAPRAARRRRRSARSTSRGRRCCSPRRAGRLIRTADRPRRRRRARPPARHGALPLGHRQRPAADAPHPRPRRGRGVPRRDHRRLSPTTVAER